MADGAEPERTQQVVETCSAAEEHSFGDSMGILSGKPLESRCLTGNISHSSSAVVIKPACPEVVSLLIDHDT